MSTWIIRLGYLLTFMYYVHTHPNVVHVYVVLVMFTSLGLISIAKPTLPEIPITMGTDTMLYTSYKPSLIPFQPNYNISTKLINNLVANKVT